MKGRIAIACVLVFASVLVPRVLQAGPNGASGDSANEPNYHGKPLHEWVIATGEKGPDFSPSAHAREAFKAIAAIGPAAAIPWLIKWLKPPINDVRLLEGTANSFKIFGAQADGAIPQLTSIFDLPGNSPEIVNARMFAAQSLGYLGPKAVPALLSAATNSSLEPGRFAIFMSLADYATNAPEIIPALVQWSHDPDDSTRLDAIMALGHAAQRPDLVLPVLRNAIKDTNDAIRNIAAEGFGGFGKAARNDVPELIKLLDDPKASQGAIFALGKIGKPREVILPILVKKLHDPDWGTRRVAASALGDFGGKKAFDALIRVSDDPNRYVRDAVFQSLEKIDPERLKQSGKYSEAEKN